MKRTVCMLNIILLSVVQLFAQQRLTIEIDRLPIYRLYDWIEEQTGSRIYCAPGEADTLTVTVRAVNREPLEILQEALQRTPYRVTKYRNMYFIQKEREFFVPLFDNYYITERQQEPLDETFRKSLFDDESKQTSGSEQIVHEIGNAKTPKTGVVALSGKITNIKTGEPLPGITH